MKDLLLPQAQVSQDPKLLVSLLHIECPLMNKSEEESPHIVACMYAFMYVCIDVFTQMKVMPSFAHVCARVKRKLTGICGR